jgi:hypothetical protein
MPYYDHCDKQGIWNAYYINNYVKNNWNWMYQLNQCTSSMEISTVTLCKCLLPHTFFFVYLFYHSLKKCGYSSKQLKCHDLTSKKECIYCIFTICWKRKCEGVIIVICII